MVFPPGTRIAEVDDCKRLDPATRERLAPLIRARAIAFAVAFVEPDEIDRINIYWAGVAAMKRALAALGFVPDHVLIDGPGRGLKDIEASHRGIIGGDQLSLSIAAASILAKTARDARMRQLDLEYPGYGLGKHKGYPVKEHFSALAAPGPLSDPPALVCTGSPGAGNARRIGRKIPGKIRRSPVTGGCRRARRRYSTGAPVASRFGPPLGTALTSHNLLPSRWTVGALVMYRF